MNINILQRSATLESSITNGFNKWRNFNFFQQLAFKKGIITNTFNRTRYSYLFCLITDLKFSSKITNFFNGWRNRDFFKWYTWFKGWLTNWSHRRRYLYFIKWSTFTKIMRFYYFEFPIPNLVTEERIVTSTRFLHSLKM